MNDDEKYIFTFRTFVGCGLGFIIYLLTMIFASFWCTLRLKCVLIPMVVKSLFTIVGVKTHLKSSVVFEFSFQIDNWKRFNFYHKDFCSTCCNRFLCFCESRNDQIHWIQVQVYIIDYSLATLFSAHQGP